jgi:hypothetical protein
MANNTSISNLNEVEEVNSGDFFIIDTPSGTQKIDFGNVLIPLDNATFNTTISAHAEDIAQNRTELKTLTSALYNGVDQNLKLNSVNVLTQLSAVSGNITSLSADGGRPVYVRDTVIQKVYGKDDTQYSITTDASVQTFISAGITPREKGSKILGQFVISGIYHGGNGGFGFDIARHDTTNNTMTYLVSGYNDAAGSLDLYALDNHYYPNNVIIFEDDIPAGSTELRYILSADERDSGTLTVNYTNGTGAAIKYSFAILNEIAQ